MTPRERILVLLDNYVDVVNGLRDRQGDGVHVPLMCRPWNTPLLGYPTLERLRLRLQREDRPLYLHLAHTYFVSGGRMVLQCPRCQAVYPMWSSPSFHRHGRDTVAVKPRVLRLTPLGVDTGKVGQAVDWLLGEWPEPGPYLPDELKREEVAA